MTACSSSRWWWRSASFRLDVCPWQHSWASDGPTPLQLRYRWDHRRAASRTLIRWVILVLAPYGLVPLLAVLMMVPAIVILVQSHEGNSHLVNFVNAIGMDVGIHISPGTRPMSTGIIVLCVAVTCAVAAITWFPGRWANLRLIQRLPSQLQLWLSDPTMG